MIKPAVYIIEMLLVPITLECGAWDRSIDYPNFYTEEEANNILANNRNVSSKLVYRKTQVNL
jgi:hypothetical protein